MAAHLEEVDGTLVGRDAPVEKDWVRSRKLRDGCVRLLKVRLFFEINMGILIRTLSCRT